MKKQYQLSLTDYSAIILMLVISTAIGFAFRISSKNKRTIKEYLMAGQNMSKLPVILSIVVSMISSVSMIAVPAEMYQYGMQFAVYVVGTPIGIALTSYIFVPVYFQCGVSTVYEFIDLRFGKETRYILSTCFLLQTTLFMAPILYAPVLAINAVTNLSVEAAILLFGAICTLYSTVGGLKGILWADVFQSSLMLMAMVAFCASGLAESGGMGNAFLRSIEGGRMKFDFGIDLRARFSVWNTFAIGLLFSFSSFGTNQVEVQRLLSLGNLRRAKSALLISSIPMMILSLLSCLCGLVLYSVYYECDPILNKNVTGLTRYDQVVPYYIISKFHSVPGLTGLLMAGIFCGSLTTISSALNSLAAVTVVDFIHPFAPSTRTNNTKSVFLAISFTCLYGVVIVLLTFAIRSAGSLIQITLLLHSITETPSVAVFTVGILSRKCTSRSALFGFFVGVALTAWAAVGAMFSGYRYTSLPVTSNGCEESESYLGIWNTTTSCQYYGNCTSTKSSTNEEIFYLYKMGYFWVKILSFIITVFFILLSTIIIDWNKTSKPVDERCLSPITRLWNKNGHSAYTDVALDDKAVIETTEKNTREHSMQL